MKNEALFRDKPVWTVIFSLAIPSCITILIMTIYNMADMFFVGMLGDTAQVAAVSIVSPVFSLVMAAATMLGAGGCAVVANAIGAGKKEDAKTYSSLCCMASVILGVKCYWSRKKGRSENIFQSLLYDFCSNWNNLFSSNIIFYYYNFKPVRGK